MKAARIHGPNILKIDEIDIPKVRNNEILLKVEAASMCGTDPIFYHHGVGEVPLVSGHEYAGMITEVGEGVKGFKIGDRVLGGWGISCGECWYCRQGKPNICDEVKVFGLHLDGSQAEYMIVPKPERVLTKLPEEISSDEGALLCCTLPTSVYGVKRAQIGIGDRVAILGLGVVGISAVVASKLAGAGYIIASDPSKYRGEIALKFGADVALALEEPSAEIRRLIDGRGADHVLVTTPAPQAVETAIKAVRKGGKVTVIGSVMIAPVNFAKVCEEVDVIGVMGMIGPDHLSQVIDLVHKDKIDLGLYRSLITHRIPLEEMNRAMSLFETKSDRDKPMKIIINF